MAEPPNLSDPASGQALSIDNLFEKAVENAVNKHVMKFVEVVDKAVQKIDEAVEKALEEGLARLSQRSSEIHQRGHVNGAAVGTSMDTMINDPRESDQEFMEIEEDESESDDEYPISDLYCTSWEKDHPDEGSTYAIHVDNGHRSMLAVDGNSKLMLQPYLHDGYRIVDSKYCHWEFLAGSNGYYHFSNVATGEYLAVDPTRLHKGSPVLTTSLDGIVGDFNVKPGFRSFLEQKLLAVYLDRPFYVTAEYDSHDRLNLVCKSKKEKPHTRWLFRQVWKPRRRIRQCQRLA